MNKGVNYESKTASQKSKPTVSMSSLVEIFRTRAKSNRICHSSRANRACIRYSSSVRGLRNFKKDERSKTKNPRQSRSSYFTKIVFCGKEQGQILIEAVIACSILIFAISAIGATWLRLGGLIQKNYQQENEYLDRINRNERLPRNINESGFISVIGILFICLATTVLFTGISIALKQQEHLSIKHRLQVCALESINRHSKLLKELRRLNQIMIPLRATVISLRTARLVPGAGSVVATVAEKIALKSLKLLQLSQNSLIKKTRIQNTIAIRCRHSKFSSHPLICRQPKIRPQTLRRKKTPFRDVAGHLYLTQAIHQIFTTQCWNPKSLSRDSRTKISLYGDESLRWNHLSYAYKK